MRSSTMAHICDNCRIEIYRKICPPKLYMNLDIKNYLEWMENKYNYELSTSC